MFLKMKNEDFILEKIYLNLGPKLPFKIDGSTMIQSPTEKGVVVIGGNIFRKGIETFEISTRFIELSGDSEDTLKWTILEQKLKYPRFLHVSFSIPNEIADKLYTKNKYSQDQRRCRLNCNLL